jgi:eukaryotic-like serine/threonine-protein kinase
VLYEQVTGVLPFDGADDVSAIQQVVGIPPLPPKVHNPQVDEELSRIILRAIAIDPDDRHQTAEELAQDLRRYLAHLEPDGLYRPLDSYVSDLFLAEVSSGAEPLSKLLAERRFPTPRPSLPPAEPAAVAKEDTELAAAEFDEPIDDFVPPSIPPVVSGPLPPSPPKGKPWISPPTVTTRSARTALSWTPALHVMPEGAQSRATPAPLSTPSLEGRTSGTTPPRPASRPGPPSTPSPPPFPSQATPAQAASTAEQPLRRAAGMESLALPAPGDEGRTDVTPAAWPELAPSHSSPLSEPGLGHGPPLSGSQTPAPTAPPAPEERAPPPSEEARPAQSQPMSSDSGVRGLAELFDAPRSSSRPVELFPKRPSFSAEELSNAASKDIFATRGESRTHLAFSVSRPRLGEPAKKPEAVFSTPRRYQVEPRSAPALTAEALRAAQAFDRGLEHFGNKRNELALAAWREAVELDPSNGAYRANLRRLERLIAPARD